jgi:hypothetical protein
MLPYRNSCRYGWSLYWDLRIFITQLLTGERFVNDPSMPI